MTAIAVRLATLQAVSLRRRRGLFWWSLVLTVGSMLLAYAILIGLHAADAAAHGPAGGVSNYRGSMDVLSLVTVLAATLLGTTAGAGDLGAGVFRDLVATGRPRPLLYLTCLAGALATLLPLVAAGYAVATGAAFAFAGGLEMPPAADVAGFAGYLAAVALAVCAIALGVAQLIGSRGIAIGVVLGWFLIVEHLLGAFTLLGVSREALVGVALDRLRPLVERDDSHMLAMSPVTALLVIAAWIAVALALGTWRASTRDL